MYDTDRINNKEKTYRRGRKQYQEPMQDMSLAWKRRKDSSVMRGK